MLTLFDKAEQSGVVNPNRKLLLLALVHRANKHFNGLLPAEHSPFFDFNVAPDELQALIGTNLENVMAHLRSLVSDGFIEFKPNYRNAVDWHLVVNLAPLCRKKIEWSEK